MGRIRETLGAVRGAAMVEAAIFYPIMLLSIMFVVYMGINLYDMTAQQAQTHLAVRKAAAEKEGRAQVKIVAGYRPDRYLAAAEARGMTMGEGARFGAKYVMASRNLVYRGGRLVKQPAEASFHGRAWVQGGMTLARMRDLLSS